MKLSLYISRNTAYHISPACASGDVLAVQMLPGPYTAFWEITRPDEREAAFESMRVERCRAGRLVEQQEFHGKVATPGRDGARQPLDPAADIVLLHVRHRYYEL